MQSNVDLSAYYIAPSVKVLRVRTFRSMIVPSMSIRSKHANDCCLNVPLQAISYHSIECQTGSVLTKSVASPAISQPSLTLSHLPLERPVIRSGINTRGEKMDRPTYSIASRFRVSLY